MNQSKQPAPAVASPARQAAERLVRLASRALGVPVVVLTARTEGGEEIVASNRPLRAAAPAERCAGRSGAPEEGEAPVAEGVERLYRCGRAPLEAAPGVRGALCAFDAQPGALVPEAQETLAEFARLAAGLLEAAPPDGPARAGSTGDAGAARFESLFEHSPAPIVVHAAGEIVEANGAAAQLLGAERPEDLVGRKVEDFFHPDSLERGRARFRILYERGGAVPAVEQRARRLDGAVVDVEVSSARTEFGGRPAVCSLFRDITHQKRAGEEVRRVQRFYENLLDEVPAQVVAFDPQGRYLYVSASAVKDPALRAWMIGRTNEDYVRRKGLDPALAEARQGVIEQVVREKRTVTRHESIAGADGRLRHFVRVYAPALGPDGQVSHVNAFGVDITESKRAEQALREAEAKFRALVEQSLVGIYIIQDGRVVYANPRLLGMFGFHPDTDPSQFQLSDVIAPRDLPRVVANLDSRLRGEPALSQYRFCGRRRDGRDIELEVYVGSIEYEGRTAAIGVLLDVTERTRAEEELRASDARHRSLSRLISAVAFSFRFSPGGEPRLEWATESVQEVFGYTADELRELSFGAYFHPDDLPLLREHIEELRRGDSTVGEYRVFTKSGALRWMRAYNYPEWDATGTAVARFYGAMQDVTDQKAVEAELIQARDRAEELNRLKFAFLTNMSHEIRTPLASIIGFSEILANEVPPENREFAELISRGGRRLLDTLNSVLDLAQLESRTFKLYMESLDVAEQVQEVVDLLRPQAEEAGLWLRFERPAGAVRATLDGPAFGRVLTNLLSNALKFTEQGGVTVCLKAEAREFSVVVEDTGIGIGEEFLPHLFEDFRQESSGMTRRFEGSGLGLTITKKLVELMGGRIEVESVVGRGSRFTVTFPLEQPPAALPEAPEPPPEPAAQRRPSVLVVEDNPEMRQLLGYLVGDRYALALTGDVDQALDMAAARPFDAVMLDINLGEERTGEDVLRLLRERPDYAHVPVIAMTAYALPGDRERFLSRGFDEYLSKPFLKQHILEALGRVMK